MKSVLTLLLVAVSILALASCGSEGGVVGSGISSATISGNIVAVDEDSAAAALPPVEISLEEFSGVEATSSDDGAFDLTGDFAGPLTVRFETPGGRLLARLSLDVPAGSTVELNDLEISLGMARPREIRQRNFIGRVAQVNCALPGFLLDDDVNRPFRIHLGDEAQIRVRPGNQPGTCDDILPGAFARVEGIIVITDVGPVVEAATIVVGQTRPPREPLRR